MTAPAKATPTQKPKPGTGAAAKAIGEAAPKKEKPTGPQYTRKAYKAREGYKLYEAKGRAGKINVRGFSQVMTFAADVQDLDHPNEDWHLGVITRFFTSKEKAEAYKAKKEEGSEGRVNVKIVAANPYKGQGEE